MKKRTIALALVSTAFLLLTSCRQVSPSYAVSEFPWGMTTEQAKEQLDADGVVYTEETTEQTTTLFVEKGQLFSIDSSQITLEFDAEQQLKGITGLVNGTQFDRLKKEIEAVAGTPVTSYTPAAIHTIPDWVDENGNPLFSVYLDDSFALDENFLIWHSAKPLSATWTEEERQQWMEAMQAILEPQGYSFADASTDIWQKNGEELTVWHGQEAWDAWFENNWQDVVWVENLSEGCRVSFTHLRPTSYG